MKEKGEENNRGSERVFKVFSRLRIIHNCGGWGRGMRWGKLVV